jgi:indolepyruvate ferredoxin oxidoreductase beta subunit
VSPRSAAVPVVTTVSLAGVGGQGIILAAAILANAAMAAGFDVKASEVKGMAQRGGSVVSTVRFGRQVWSPLAPHADLVIATEELEGRRSLALLRDGGTLVAATTKIAPGSVLRGERAYPSGLEEAAAARGVRLLCIDAETLAVQAGTIRAANVALLGAAGAVLPFDDDAWRRGLELAVPAKILEVNQRAFALGRDAAAHQEG